MLLKAVFQVIIESQRPPRLGGLSLHYANMVALNNGCHQAISRIDLNGASRKA